MDWRSRGSSCAGQERLALSGLACYRKGSVLVGRQQLVTRTRRDARAKVPNDFRNNSEFHMKAFFVRWPRGATPYLSSDYDTKRYGVLSFLDLVDAAVSEVLLRRFRVSHTTVRRLRSMLSRRWETKHPFSRSELRIDPTTRTVFLELAEEEGEPRRVIDVLQDQQAFPELMAPFLRRINYDRDQVAMSVSLTDRVVIDPLRRCGKPIVSGQCMPTVILYNCFLATNSQQVAADWYGVGIDDVDAAIEFEREFKGLAA